MENEVIDPLSGLRIRDYSIVFGDVMSWVSRSRVAVSVFSRVKVREAGPGPSWQALSSTLCELSVGLATFLCISGVCSPDPKDLFFGV